MALEAGERPVLRRKGLSRDAGDRPPPPRVSDSERFGCPPAGWRRRLHTVVFETDTRAGRAFDIAVIAAILTSIVVVMVDSVQPLAQRHGRLLAAAEWAFTTLFTLEYLARLASVQRPLRYATSFYGVIDLLALLPTYLAALVPEAHLLIDVRVLRLLRVFRIFRLTGFLAETALLTAALRASARKIAVFLSFVLMVVLVMGTVMHIVEGPANGFTSIPMAMYWAVSTMTTVGFGDIVPKTDLGRLIASVMMLMGWGVLAVPTGIVTAEMALARRLNSRTRRCPACDTAAATDSARHCHQCGARLPAFGRRTA
jgi:voltage-gated potassium channel